MPPASTPRTLDPSFASILDAAEDAGWLPRAVAREQAEAIARSCGMTFAEALRSIGRLPPLPKSYRGCYRRPSRNRRKTAHFRSFGPAPHPSTVSVHGLGETRAAEILAALVADPSRSDRDVARACGCSPTLVGRVRAAAGLAKRVREVRRGGRAYTMALSGSGAPTP